MASRKLIEASNKLAKYYGLYTSRDLAGYIALDQTTGVNQTGTSEFNFGNVPQYLQEVLDLIVNTSEGAPATIDMLNKINEVIQSLSGADRTQEEENLRRALTIFYGNADGEKFIPDRIQQLGQEDPNRYVPITEMLAPVDSTSDNPADFVNQTLAAPSKNSPTLSVIYSNSRRATPNVKNVNPLVIFLNGIPTTEMSLATPFLNIQFFQPRGPTAAEPQKRLQSTSLLRFLIGAERTDQNGVLSSLAEANRVTGSIISPDRDTNVYTQTGMEIFTAPQTLVNADEPNSSPSNIDSTSIRSVPVLNKFAPAASLKSFSVSIKGTTGLMSYKTGELSFVIHDRSRMSEFADFIKPDLYGGSEILVEYGYSHPHANSSSGPENPYAVLLNEMRVKEKYGIVNSSFTFDDSGQVIVTLRVAMRGGIESRSENIAAGEVSGPINDLRNISETISSLRQRVFRTTENLPQREVRGLQFLDLAQDQTAQLILSSELKEQAKELRRLLSTAQSPDAQELLRALTSLFGSLDRPRNNIDSGGLRDRIRRSVTDSINDKIRKMASTPDPMLRIPFELKEKLGEARARAGARLIADRYRGLNQDQRRNTREYFQLFERTGGVNVAPVSLAKLLLTFVGEPMARTGKFDDVQLIFYPFNDKAGYAKTINIGEFQVDLQYFATEYTRYRLENVARAGNVNVRDFLRFVAETLTDDPAAISYGLIQGRQQNLTPIWRDVVAANNRNQSPINDAPIQNQLIEEALRDVTGGEFRMPQVEFFLEAVPRRVVQEEGVPTDDGNSQTILRIHVYDKTCSPYSTISQILEAQRNDQINSIPGAPLVSPTDAAVSEENAQEASRIIQLADNFNLLEKLQETVQGADGQSITVDRYVIRGGPTAIKNFLYRSTPYIIYGAAGTNVVKANVSSQQNAQLSTVNMLRSLRADPLQPTGEQPGGLPLSVIPSEGTMDLNGCPLLEYTQQFFIDFQTGTSIDNIYAFTDINHTFEPGSFRSTAKFVPIEAYGKYSSLTENIRTAIGIVNRYQSERQQTEGNRG